MDALSALDDSIVATQERFTQRADSRNRKQMTTPRIMPGDPEAIAKLQDRIAEHEKCLREMERVNETVELFYPDRKLTDRGSLIALRQALNARHVEPRTVNRVLDDVSDGFIGFGRSDMGSIRNMISRDRRRVKDIRAIRAMACSEEYGDSSLVADPELMRVQIFFADTHGDVVSTLLQKKGFLWSPRNQCYQRQLTKNALSDARHLCETFLQSGITD